jgi:hypothetical protein
LQYGYLVGLLTLRLYSCKYSRKTYNRPQLFACLVLKEFLRLDYRKVTALLRDSPDLAGVIELKSVPHFTTLQKAASRLLGFRPARRLLDQTIHVARWQRNLPATVPLTALDGTGLESHHASSYYVRRRAKGGKNWQSTTYKRFPKVGILCDCRSHLILAVVPGRGPAPDIPHFRAALDQALSRVRIAALAADAGYDAEHSHEFAREQRDVRSLIPAKIGRQTTKPARGYWRRQMQSRLHLTRYPQRWQAETVNSMLKRLLGSALRARSYWSQCREILLRTITLNIMILRRRQGFYRATLARIRNGSHPPASAGQDPRRGPSCKGMYDEIACGCLPRYECLGNEEAIYTEIFARRKENDRQ